MSFAQILIAKHRNGQVGDVNLKFVNKFAKFVNPDTDFAAFNTAVPFGMGDAILAITLRISDHAF